MNFMLKHCDAIREKVRSGQLEIQGGVYDLSTGKARVQAICFGFLREHLRQLYS